MTAAFESYCNGVTDIIAAVAQQVKRNMATKSDSTMPEADSTDGRPSGTMKGRKLIPGLGGVLCHAMTAAAGVISRIMINAVFLGTQGACIFI